MSRGVAGSGQSENLTMHLVSMLVRGRAVAAVFSSCTAECGTLTWTVDIRYTETRYIDIRRLNELVSRYKDTVDTHTQRLDTGAHPCAGVVLAEQPRLVRPHLVVDISIIYLHIYSHVMTHLVNAEPPVGRVTLHPLHHTHPGAVVQLNVNYVLCRYHSRYCVNTTLDIV